MFCYTFLLSLCFHTQGFVNMDGSRRCHVMYVRNWYMCVRFRFFGDGLICMCVLFSVCLSLFFSNSVTEVLFFYSCHKCLPTQTKILMNHFYYLMLMFEYCIECVTIFVVIYFFSCSFHPLFQQL